MKVTLFTKEQLLNGYLDVRNSSTELAKFYEMSVIYHEIPQLHEDYMWDCEYLSVEGEGGIKQSWNLEEVKPLKELSLWDLVL